MIHRFLLLASLYVLCMAASCDQERPIPLCTECPTEEEDPLIEGPSVPTLHELEIPDYLPRPVLDPENPITVEGIALGRRLFYDKILGRDSSFACADCHLQELAFTDGRELSVGVSDRIGRRNSMSIVNLVFNGNGFNWDGSSEKLWEQAIHPVENMLEMDEDWANVLERIRRHPDYRQRFRAAFGVDRGRDITREMAVKAIAQFENTIISADSRFDQIVYRNEGFFTEEEQFGADSLFFVEDVPIGALHPGCGHCHNAPSFGDNQFKNNGLDGVASLDDFTDKGFGKISGSRFDNGKFRTPTLRNIALTAPYMHDGRFATLEEVIESYAAGGHGVENEDPNITGFALTEEKMRAMVAFLNTLTDESITTDERFSNPF